MSTEKDVQIFCCGITQYAMSSGKFDLEDLPRIADTAYDWFVGKFGKPVPEATYVPKSSPGASQRPQKPDWKAAVPAAGSGDVQPETKAFTVWGGDKAYLFGNNEKLWADWLADAQNGDDASREALEKASRASLGKDPKWHEANARRIARAKACLLMLAQGQAGG